MISDVIARGVLWAVWGMVIALAWLMVMPGAVALPIRY